VVYTDALGRVESVRSVSQLRSVSMTLLQVAELI
jgi:hypothetical protein